MHDFSIYSSNRHSIYNDLYQKILIATKSIELLSVAPIKTDYLMPEDQGEFEDLLYFRKYDFKDDEQEYLEKLWDDQDLETLQSKIIHLEKRKRTKDAKGNVRELEVIFLESELFISDEVSLLTSDLIENITSFIKSYIRGIDEEIAKARYETINKLHGKIKSIIKKELSIGFYSND